MNSQSINNLKLNKVLILAFLFAAFSGCRYGGAGNLASRVHVIVNPYGEGDSVRSSRPIIHRTPGMKICRQKPFNIRDARSLLRRSGLDQTFLEDIFGEEEVSREGSSAASAEGSTSEGESDSSESSSRLKPVKTDVSENWLRFGLYIANYNRAGYFLIIDNITFFASSVYRGRAFSHSGSIDSGYCEGEASYLYIVPAGRAIRYSPLSKNPFHNLSIFIGGFEIIDRRAEPSCAAQRSLRIAGGGSGAQSSASSGASASAAPSAAPSPGAGAENECYNDNEILVIPDYKVELTLSGYFATKTGIPVETFVKRVHFFTRSSLR